MKPIICAILISICVAGHTQDSTQKMKTDTVMALPYSDTLKASFLYTSAGSDVVKFGEGFIVMFGVAVYDKTGKPQTWVRPPVVQAILNSQKKSYPKETKIVQVLN